MTHLRIEQNNGVIEEVNISIITKLYEIAFAGLDVSSNLKGRLHTPVSYRSHIEYLTGTYPELYINSDDYAIPFEDPNMITYLNSIGVGNNGVVTEAQAAAATIVANSQNTEVTKFNELKYFTNITSSRGGWTGVNSGYTRFRQWTALEEVDISNFTSLGHVNGYAYEDTFLNCTSLKTVTASDKLTKIGWSAFSGCTNLEHITGLSGTIQVSTFAFLNCSKLTDEDIVDVEFEPAYDGTVLRGERAFQGTKFTEITLSPNTTEIPISMFEDCSELETVNNLGSNITQYRNRCFFNCKKFVQSVDFSNVGVIMKQAFQNSALSGNISLPTLYTTSGESHFQNTYITSATFNPNVYQTTLSSSMFEGCKNLTTVTGLSNITIVDNYCFKDCTSLQNIDINPQKITSLGAKCFQNCSNLQNLVSINFPNLTELKTSYNSRQQFRNCSQIQHIVNLGSITEIGDIFGEGTFDMCTGLQTVILPETLQIIKYTGFTNCNNIKWVKVLATSVPTYDVTDGHGYTHIFGRFFGELFRNNDVQNEYLGNTYPIYVRDNLYQSYLTAPVWQYIAFRIKPISQFATDFPNG